MSRPHGAPKRRLRNLLVFPDSQIRYGTLFLAVSSATHIFFSMVAMNLYMLWQSEVDNRIPFQAVIAFLVAVYFVLQVFAFVFGLFISHKVMGPIVPIIKFIDGLTAGKFEGPLQLRKTDDPNLKDLAEALNRHANSLRK